MPRSRASKNRVRGGPSKSKACKILRDGKVRGRKLTRKQQKLMGARCHS